MTCTTVYIDNREENTMKIEKITANAYQKQLYHITSSEIKEVKMKGKQGEIDAIGYVENYITESGFKLLNVYSGTSGVDCYILTKE